MRLAALVLGRAGSRGLPGKNTRPIAGRPCALHSIDHARAASTVAAVALSSDDHELLRLARDAGAEPIQRPPDLARDHDPVDDAARHALETLERRAGLEFHAVAILYANVPVRPADLTDRAARLLHSSRCHSVQSYAPVGKHHPLWTAVLDPDADGALRPWQGDTLNNNIFRRQDLPPAHLPDGGALLVTRDALRLELPNAPHGPHRFLGSERRGVLTAPGDVVDIDDDIDALVADTLLRARNRTPC